MIFDLQEEILRITRCHAALNGIDMTIPCRVSQDLSRHEHAQMLADRSVDLPDFSEPQTVAEVVPAMLAKPMADLMTVFQMGKGADKDELMKSCAAVERALLSLYNDL